MVHYYIRGQSVIREQDKKQPCHILPSITVLSYGTGALSSIRGRTLAWFALAGAGVSARRSN